MKHKYWLLRHQVKKTLMNHHTHKEYELTWCNKVVGGTMKTALTPDKTECLDCLRKIKESQK